MSEIDDAGKARDVHQIDIFGDGAATFVNLLGNDPAVRMCEPNTLLHSPAGGTAIGTFYGDLAEAAKKFAQV